MRISLIVIGKTSAPWLREGIQEYVGRLARYAPFRYVELPDAKLRSSKPSPDQLQAAEAPILIKALADAGVLAGLPRPLAAQLAAQTILGAGELLVTGQSAAELRAAAGL